MRNERRNIIASIEEDSSLELKKFDLEYQDNFGMWPV